MSKDQFAIKPRGHNRYKYKYIFTGKHWDAIAQVISAKYQEYRSRDDAEAQAITYAVALDIADMLARDNNRFDRNKFLKETVI